MFYPFICAPKSHRLWASISGIYLQYFQWNDPFSSFGNGSLKIMATTWNKYPSKIPGKKHKQTKNAYLFEIRVVYIKLSLLSINIESLKLLVKVYGYTFFQLFGAKAHTWEQKRGGGENNAIWSRKCASVWETRSILITCQVESRPFEKLVCPLNDRLAPYILDWLLVKRVPVPIRKLWNPCDSKF